MTPPVDWGAGCDEPACQQAVCNALPYCCNPNNDWDADCAAEAASINVCGDLCDHTPHDWGCGPGWRPVEHVWYQYITGPTDMQAAGNPQFITRQVYDPAGPCEPVEYVGYAFHYNSAGSLWFISQWRWTQEAPCTEPQKCMPFPLAERVSVHEFRSVGRAMRLTRQRQGCITCGVVDVPARVMARGLLGQFFLRRFGKEER